MHQHIPVLPINTCLYRSSVHVRIDHQHMSVFPSTNAYIAHQHLSVWPSTHACIANQHMLVSPTITCPDSTHQHMPVSPVNNSRITQAVCSHMMNKQLFYNYRLLSTYLIFRSSHHDYIYIHDPFVTWILSKRHIILVCFKNFSLQWFVKENFIILSEHKWKNVSWENNFLW